MSETLLPLFLKQLNELDTFIVNDKHSRRDILDQLRKIKAYLVKNRSVQEHRLCQAYITHLFLNYGEGAGYASRELFVDALKFQLGFSKIMPEKKRIKGEIVQCIKYMNRSLSFTECSQKDHHEFFNNLMAFAAEKWSDDFEAWRNYYENNENLTQ